MTLMHIKPNKKMFVRHSIGTYIFGIALTTFSVVWVFLWVSFEYKQYLLGTGIKMFLIRGTMGTLIGTFFIIYGIIFSYGFYKKRSTYVADENYYLTQDQLIIERHDAHTSISFKDIKEIIVVHPLVYFDKNCVDIYFKRSEKEVIFTDNVFPKNSAFRNPNIKWAERMIGVEGAEETVKKIIEEINKNREDNISYIVKKRL